MDTFEDIVLTTRIRFARNIKGYNFPHNMSNKMSKEVLEKIKEATKSNYTFLELNNMDEVTKKSLVETHMISKELLDGENTGIILDEKNNITTMVNEEDHLRIQAFEKGFNIKEAYDHITTLDNALSKVLDYAYDEDYGYITACPTCLGTGMRVSVMLHLPGLEKLKLIDKIFYELSNLGVSIRGMYGENTSSEGSIYQISNQKTLGISQKDIIEQVSQVTNYIVKQERKAREILKNQIEEKDEVYRAYGILQNAILMPKKEAMQLLSSLRMGASMNMIDVPIAKIDEIIENIGKNTLRKKLKEHFPREQENIKRAEYIKQNI